MSSTGHVARATALIAAVAIGALPLTMPRPVRPAVPLLAGDGGWCGTPAREIPPDPGGQPVHHPTVCLAHCARPAPAGDGGAVIPDVVTVRPPSGAGTPLWVPLLLPVVPVQAATPGARAPPAA